MKYDPYYKPHTIKLALQKKWFDMIASGEKREEYREITDFYAHRLCEEDSWWNGKGTINESAHDDYVIMNENTLYNGNLLCEYVTIRSDIKYVEFALGFQKDRAKMTFEVEEISFALGWQEWGAKMGEYYFVIKLGERIS